MKRIAVLIIILPEDDFKCRIIQDEEEQSIENNFDNFTDMMNSDLVVEATEFFDITDRKIILNTTLEDFVEDLRKRDDFNSEV